MPPPKKNRIAMNKTNHSAIQNIKPLFPGLNNEVLDEIIAENSLKILEPGEFLIKQNTPCEAYHILLQGRLRAIQDENNNRKAKVLGDIGVGEPVGELAFFSNSLSMASVLAIRKSRVLTINQEGYEKIIKHQPTLSAATHKFIIDRLKRNQLESNRMAPPKNIAVLNLNPDEDLSSWTEAMENYFEKEKLQLHIYDEGLPDGMNPMDYFQRLEDNEGLNLLIINENDLEWSKHSCLYADLIVVASKFDKDPALSQLEQELEIYKEGLLSKKVYLLLLHPEDALQPINTAKWLKPREVDLHIHVRKWHQKDTERFCRIINHTAVGVVLGGGGAKGFAHIGALRALAKKGVPIDFIGGTSAGALYGISVAFADFDDQLVDHICEDSVKQKVLSNDWSLPIVSIMTGTKLTRFFKTLFKTKDLEDLWTNSYCVSTNFSKAQMTVHERGEIWRRLRASISIPGIFPPVVINSHLHVDGAVMDNLPIEPMYRFPVSRIFAIALSGVKERKVTYKEAPTSNQVLRARVLGKTKLRIPGIASIIINSLTLSSLQKQEETRSKVSNFLELDLKGVSFLDNKKWRSIVKKGYEQTLHWLEKEI
jgi:predicted acylesterase/phospholipase RssA